MFSDYTDFESNKRFINWVQNRIWIRDQSLSTRTLSQSEEWTMQWVLISYEQKQTEALWHEVKELSNHWQHSIQKESTMNVKTNAYEIALKDSQSIINLALWH